MASISYGHDPTEMPLLENILGQGCQDGGGFGAVKVSEGEFLGKLIILVLSHHQILIFFGKSWEVFGMVHFAHVDEEEPVYSVIWSRNNKIRGAVVDVCHGVVLEPFWHDRNTINTLVTSWEGSWKPCELVLCGHEGLY